MQIIIAGLQITTAPATAPATTTTTTTTTTNTTTTTTTKSTPPGRNQADGRGGWSRLRILLYINIRDRN